MKTSSKLFGGSHILHMTSQEEKKELLEHIFVNTGVALPEKTKQYKLLSQSNFPILKKGYYALAVPDDLEIYIYFTRHKGRRMCYLICRKLTPGHIQPKILVIFPQCGDDDIYDGTLIEAVRVRANDEKFFILATDLLWRNGSKNTHESYIKRLDELGKIISSELTENFSKFPFRIQLVSPYVHLNLLESRLKNLPYKVNRVLFYPEKRKHDSLYYPLDSSVC
tara:strand:+ start:10410 stop:11078 length:669 start_codon:yes stop_codon:yes gene_type:complete